MRQKFGRRLSDKDAFGYTFSVDFEVESYLRYRGQQFVSRFDANSYLYITKAMDYFDLSAGLKTLSAAFDRMRTRFSRLELLVRTGFIPLTNRWENRERFTEPQYRRGFLRTGITVRTRPPS